jgi:hypothetical protein
LHMCKPIIVCGAQVLKAARRMIVKYAMGSRAA